MIEDEVMITDELTEEPEATVVAEVVTFEDRPFLSTPLNEYTVTEGLLLLILLFYVGRSIMGWIKEGFFWLW